MDDMEKSLRQKLGDEVYEAVAPFIEGLSEDQVEVLVLGEVGEMVKLGELDPFEEAWQLMYPDSFGNWEETDEPCPRYPDCTCNGKRMVQKVFATYLN